ncbi:hypothetical protein FRC07_010165, partial [Ceratobasidium sp. 392]
TSPRCINAVSTSLPASISSFAPTSSFVNLSQHNSSSLHSAMRIMMQGIERVSSSPFPAIAAWLYLWTSLSWRKAFNTFTAFFTKEIVRARSRESEATETRKGSLLATDADCVLDMLLQRESREGTERLSQQELLDELLTYVV